MRRLSCLLVSALCLGGSPLAAQDRWVRHYQERVAAFEAENRSLDPATRHVVLVGDSLTELWRYGDRVARFLPNAGARTLNRGISSDRVGPPRGVLSRMGSSIFDTRPSHVFLLVGVNQLGRDGSGVERAARDYAEIVRQVRARLPEVTLTVVTTSPARGSYAALNGPIRRYNERLRALASSEGLPLIDLHALLVNAEGELPADATQDGLHFNDRGYALLGREIERIVAGTPAPAGGPVEPARGGARGLRGSLEDEPPGRASGPRLRRGDRSAAVAHLQVRLGEALRQAGRPAPGVDGDFGPRTEEAVRTFRALAGLPPGGEVDAATWSALLRATEDGPLGRLNPAAFPAVGPRYARVRGKEALLDVRALDPLPATLGGARPLIFEAKMAVDADGAGDAHRSDPVGQPSTSLTYADGRALDPRRLCYMVLPIGFEQDHPGVRLGDVVAVAYQGQVAYAIFGDRGPRGTLGEGSIALAKALGIPSDPVRGGVDGGVTYVVFPGSGDGRPLDQAELNRRGASLLAAARGD